MIQYIKKMQKMQKMLCIFIKRNTKKIGYIRFCKYSVYIRMTDTNYPLVEYECFISLVWIYSIFIFGQNLMNIFKLVFGSEFYICVTFCHFKKWTNLIESYFPSINFSLCILCVPQKFSHWKLISQCLKQFISSKIV